MTILLGLIAFLVLVIIVGAFKIISLSTSRVEIEKKVAAHETTLVEVRKQLEEKSDQSNRLSESLQIAQGEKIRAETQLIEAKKNLEEQKVLLDEASQKLKDAFGSLSSDALKSNNQAFMELAGNVLEKYITEAKGDFHNRKEAIEALVKPLRDSLQQYESNLNALEVSRQTAYTELRVHLDGLKDTEGKLQKETNALVTALKSSQVRGKYGEIGLRRVVEFAGMNDFCDFEEQVSKATEEGRIRPDLIVKLPQNRTVIIDAKVPLLAYMQAYETTDENEKKKFIEQHARAVRDHLKTLSSKAYWSQFKEAPDYVVLYMQIESSFGAALEIDRNLLEDALENNIVFATPTTLITLLRTVAFSWGQERVAQNAKKVWEAGVELFNRYVVLVGYINSIGGGLKTAVEQYNKSVASLETRFIPQAKRLKDLAASSKEFPEIESIEITTRSLPDATSDDSSG